MKTWMWASPSAIATLCVGAYMLNMVYPSALGALTQRQHAADVQTNTAEIKGLGSAGNDCNKSETQSPFGSPAEASRPCMLVKTEQKGEVATSKTDITSRTVSTQISSADRGDASAVGFLLFLSDRCARQSPMLGPDTDQICQGLKGQAEKYAMRLKQLVDAGNADAQYELGVRLLSANGPPSSPSAVSSEDQKANQVNAINLLRESAAGGNEQARSMLTFFDTHASASQ